MRKVFIALVWLFCCVGNVGAAVLTVGPPGSGKTYTGSGAAICAAIAAAAATTADSGDTIELDGVAPGGGQATYRDMDCPYNKSITVTGVGALRPHVTRSTGAALSGTHGYFRPSGGYQRFNNIEFSDAKCGNNCTPIWIENLDLVTGVKLLQVDNIYSHDSDMGLLVGNHGGNNTYVPEDDRVCDAIVTHSEFTRNGIGDGISHNVYIGRIHEFTFYDNYSHDSNGGQLVKSRAAYNYVYNNRLVDSIQSGYPTTGGWSNYEASFPFGGRVYLIGNTIYQSGDVQPVGYGNVNKKIIDLCSECPAWPALRNSFHEYAVINNTVVNARTAGDGVFVSINLAVGSTTQIIEDNIFAGPGDVFWREENPATAPANNTSTSTITAMNFVNAGQLDFRLTGTSPGLDLAVDHGTFPVGCTTHCFSLIPSSQYAHPRTHITRTIVGAGRDRGALERTLAGSAYIGPVRLEASGATIFFGAAPVENTSVTGYEVRRNGAVIATTASTATNYSDTTGVAGQDYLYTVIPKGTPDGAESLPITAGSAYPCAADWGGQKGWQCLSNSDAIFSNVCTGAACTDYWSIYASASFDPTTRRYFIWGGAGHSSNEVYAFRGVERNWIAINSSDTPQANNEYAVGGTRPNNRRTYLGSAWMTTENKGYYFAGQFDSGTPAWSQRVWHFAPGTNTWADFALGFTTGDNLYLGPAVWNSNTSRVLQLASGKLYSYNPTTNVFTLINGSVAVGYRSTAVFASHANKLFYLGDNAAKWLDPATGVATDLPVSCAALKLLQYPAAGYDSDRQEIVYWDGYSTVTTINPSTGECTPQTIVGEPSTGNGIPGNALQYDPTLKAFLMARNNLPMVLLRTVALGSTGTGRTGGGSVLGGKRQ